MELPGALFGGVVLDPKSQVQEFGALVTMSTFAARAHSSPRLDRLPKAALD